MNRIRSIFWDGSTSRLRAGWRLVLQFVLLVVCLAGFGFFAQQYGDWAPRDPLDKSISILDSAAAVLSIIVSVWLAGRFVDRRRFADFGFRLGRSWWIDLAFGLALGALLQTGIFLVEITSGMATVAEAGSPAKGIGAFSASILLIFISIVVGAFAEEIWNRGYLLKNLAEGLAFKPFGRKGAIILAALFTAVIFGLGHATNPEAGAVSTLALMLAGILYATAYVLTGELAIPIGYHIAWNFFQGAVFGFPVSGYKLDTSFIVTDVTGSELWTGGGFGPEAGLLGMLARVAGILLVIAWVWRRHRKVGLKEEMTKPELLAGS